MLEIMQFFLSGFNRGGYRVFNFVRGMEIFQFYLSLVLRKNWEFRGWEGIEGYFGQWEDSISSDVRLNGVFRFLGGFG